MLDLPKHISLTIDYNPHKIYYETVAKYINPKAYRCDWINKDDQQYCIDNDYVIIVSWYPTMLIGEIRVAGSDLNKILEFIKDLL